MSRMCFKDKDGNIKFIKGINEDTFELMLTDSSSDAEYQDGGFFVESRMMFIKNHWGKEIPELKGLKEY